MNRQEITLKEALIYKKEHTVLYDHSYFCIFTNGYHNIYGSTVYSYQLGEVTKIVDHKNCTVINASPVDIICDRTRKSLYTCECLTFFTEYNGICFRFYELDGTKVTAFQDGNYYKNLYCTGINGPVTCLKEFVTFLRDIDEEYDPQLADNVTIIYDTMIAPMSIERNYSDINIIAAEN